MNKSNCRIIVLVLTLLALVVPHPGFAQEEGESFCMDCSREAWEGDSAALGKFIASCGVIDTVAYDSSNAVARQRPVVQKITMKLRSGKVLYTDSIYLIPDSMPVYRGGFTDLVRYFKETVKYPEEAKRNNIQGNVFVEFVVERDGTVRDARLVRGIGYGCDGEAVRAVSMTTGWRPGMKAGKKVRVRMKVPVRFALK